MKGYDPIKLTQKMESIVVDGNKRKYAKLSRPLRFYGGTICCGSWLQPQMQILLLGQASI